MVHPRAHLAAVTLLVALGPIGVARAEPEAAPRAIAAVGVVAPVLSHTLHGAGVLVEGGAELPLGDRDAPRLRLRARWIGLATPGARADLVAAEAIWRITPSWATRLRFEVGSGVLLEFERLQLTLPERTLDASTTRIGLPVSAGIALALGRWVELAVGYQQLLLLGDQPRTAGLAHASIGGRL
jgi:hypothetical protein